MTFDLDVQVIVSLVVPRLSRRSPGEVAVSRPAVSVPLAQVSRAVSTMGTTSTRLDRGVDWVRSRSRDERIAPKVALGRLPSGCGDPVT